MKAANPEGIPRSPEHILFIFSYAVVQNPASVVMLHKYQMCSYHSFHNFTRNNGKFFDKSQIYGIIVFEAVADFVKRRTD